MRRGLRRYARAVVLVTVNLVGTIFLMEVGLRLVPIPGFQTYLDAIRILTGQRDSYRYDPEGGMGVLIPNRTFVWSIMDGQFRITTVPFPDNDSLGLRDDGLSEEAPRKVFACGDSFTFGFGVDNDEVWHEVLESSYGGVVDIFGLRGIGASLPEIHSRYSRYKYRFAHDTVFVGIYLGNEFAEAAACAPSTTAPAGGVSRAAAATPAQEREDLRSRMYSFLRYHSYTARLVKYLFLKRLIRFGYYNYDVERDVYQPAGSPFVFTIDYEEDILVRTCELEYSPRMQAGVECFEESLAAFAQEVQAEGKELYAFVFPFKEQVYWEQWSGRLKHPERYDRLRPNYIVRSALEDVGIPYYDLTADMTEIGRTRDLYWAIDSHWSPEGNRVAAELIRKWLAVRGFPEAQSAAPWTSRSE